MLDLFLDVLAEEQDDGSSNASANSDFDDTMRQFAIGGICNCCLGLLCTDGRGGANICVLLCRQAQ